ncbi:hypothetical protein [Hydrococcus rivularis]|nr:hypothetical protein [Hydrococcus rivularis]
MISHQDHQTALPIKREIALIYAFSFLIAILMADGKHENWY